MSEDVVDCVLSCVVAFVSCMIGFGVGYYRGQIKGEERFVKILIEYPEAFSEFFDQAENEKREVQK